MHVLTLVFASLCTFAIAYRFHGLLLANKILELKAERVPPAVEFADGRDDVKTDKSVLFGHHFTAISPAGGGLGDIFPRRTFDQRRANR
jgi:carbon starvation protein